MQDRWIAEKFLNLSRQSFRCKFNLKPKVMENPKSERGFVVEINGKTYKIDILKLIFVSIFTVLPIAGIVYLMFKVPWVLYALLIISYAALAIFVFAKNVGVLDICHTVFGCRARGERYDFSKDENAAILKVMASTSINIIVLLSLIIVAVSSKNVSWILCACLAFCFLLALIELLILSCEGYCQIFVPWFKGEIFKSIKDGN